MTTRLLFVCLGNICRSPTAEGLFRRIAADRDFVIDSAGTSGWHIGSPPDARAIAEARRRGIDLSGLRGRQMTPEDFASFDLILAMDRSNVARIEEIRPTGNKTEVRLLLEFASGAVPAEVPDPYYDDNFAGVFDMLEDACAGLLETL